MVRPLLFLVPKNTTSEDPRGARSDAETLTQLFRRYAPYVGAITLRILGRREEVDDLVQDVFVAAVKGLEQLREPEAARAWLAAVTVRLCTRHLRLRKVRRWVALEREPTFELHAPGASPEQLVLLTQIYKALDTVPPSARVAWVLRIVNGEQLETIALRCNCSLATVKRRVAVAESRLEKAFHS